MSLLEYKAIHGIVTDSNHFLSLLQATASSSTI